MNKLQPLGAEKNYFVTLNRSRLIRPEHVVRSETYHHPVFTTAGMAAQRRRAELIDLEGISYAGAYWRNGFHEDGVVSALQVAERLGVPCSIEGAA